MSNWQPIETAPRDDYRGVLLALRNGRLIVGYWDGVDGEWRSEETHRGIDDPEPTHWQPLPDPLMEET